nr:DNA-binding protein [Micromonospora sp. DSM 115978]
MTGEPRSFTPPNAGQARSERVYTALFRLAERHGSTEAARSRQVNPTLLSPHEAIRLVAVLAGGSAQYLDDEPKVDGADLAAALSLVPLVRADFDDLELSLLRMARGRGVTWAEIAFGLGLGSAQAAQQRHDRLASRADADPQATLTRPGRPSTT